MSVGTWTSVLVVGEALVDVVRRADGSADESPGGSPANVALTLGRLGHTPTLLTRLGDDERGERVRAWLAESGVGVVAADAPRTATATASLDASGAATYEFDLDWALPAAGAGLSASIVHTGSIAALLEPGATDVARLASSLRQRALLTFDPNVRPALLPSREEARARVEAWVAVADLVKASDEDLAWLSPDKDPLETAEAWLASGPAVVVVTLGGGGAAALTREGGVHVDAVRADVVDTVGAGDTFMGRTHRRTGAVGLRGRGSAERAPGDQPAEPDAVARTRGPRSRDHGVAPGSRPALAGGARRRLIKDRCSGCAGREPSSGFVIPA